MSKDALKICLKRSSLSLRWEKGQIVGRIPALSEVDADLLKEYIAEEAIDGTYIDVEETIEEAEYLRKRRIRNASSFLHHIGCYRISLEVMLLFTTLDVERDWVYHHLPELNAELNTPRNVELNRIIACTPSNIADFSEKIRPVLDGVPPCLI